MINLSIILMLTGLSIIVAGASLYIIKELYEEWKAGAKEEVVTVSMYSMAIILLAVGLFIYIMFK